MAPSTNASELASNVAKGSSAGQRWLRRWAASAARLSLASEGKRSSASSASFRSALGTCERSGSSWRLIIRCSRSGPLAEEGGAFVSERGDDQRPVEETVLMLARRFGNEQAAMAGGAVQVALRRIAAGIVRGAHR